MSHIWVRIEGHVRFLLEIPEERRKIGRPRCKWEHNIKTDVKEEGWKSMNWIVLAPGYGRVVVFSKCYNKPHVA
jgi:hypothetical protein